MMPRPFSLPVLCMERLTGKSTSRITLLSAPSTTLCSTKSFKTQPKLTDSVKISKQAMPTWRLLWPCIWNRCKTVLRRTTTSRKFKTWAKIFLRKTTGSKPRRPTTRLTSILLTDISFTTPICSWHTGTTPLACTTCKLCLSCQVLSRSSQQLQSDSSLIYWNIEARIGILLAKYYWRKVIYLIPSLICLIKTNWWLSN